MSSFTCSYPNCNKIFPSKFSWRRHQNLHTGNKPFKCPNCIKSFSLAQGLKEHLYSHTKEKPYICQINGCIKSFRHPSELSRHKRIHSEYQLKKYHYLQPKKRSESKANKSKLLIPTMRNDYESNMKTGVIKDSIKINLDDNRTYYGLDTEFFNSLKILNCSTTEIGKIILSLPN